MKYLIIILSFISVHSINAQCGNIRFDSYFETQWKDFLTKEIIQDIPLSKSKFIPLSFSEPIMYVDLFNQYEVNKDARYVNDTTELYGYPWEIYSDYSLDNIIAYGVDTSTCQTKQIEQVSFAVYNGSVVFIERGRNVHYEPEEKGPEIQSGSCHEMNVGDELNGHFVLIGSNACKSRTDSSNDKFTLNGKIHSQSNISKDNNTLSISSETWLLEFSGNLKKIDGAFADFQLYKID